MTGFSKVICLLTVVLHCNGFSIRDQADLLRDNQPEFRIKSGRRFEFPQGAVIIGAPSYPNHLPEAEPILPGHTLIRPGLGMLKSSLKFPHRELEAGAGVNGNWDNLGIRYDGRNDRVLYTGFRRSSYNEPIMLFLPSKPRSHKVKTKKDAQDKILDRIREILMAEKQRNTKNLVDKRYSSEEVRKSRQENGRDQFLTFMLHNPKINEPNQAIENNLKSWILNDLYKVLTLRNKHFFLNKENYLDRLIKSIQRRYKIEERQEDESFDKRFFDQNKDVFEEFKLPYGKPDENDFKEIESASSELEPEADFATTQNPKHKTKEQRKREWFWQTKDSGNHIKINPNALEYRELIPKLPRDNALEDIRSWWFYNQADHKNLQEKRRQN